MAEEHARPGLSRGGHSHYFVLAVAVFITCLVTANITAVKLVDVFGLVVPAAIVIFPVSYIVGDVLTQDSRRRDGAFPPQPIPRARNTPDP